jgi:hypothetical protein
MQSRTSRTSQITRARGWLATRPRLRRSALAVLAVGTLAGAGIASQATAQPSVMKVSGKVETLLGPGPNCTAATGLCFAGEIHGDVSGKVEGAVNSFVPTQQPDVALVDATVTFHTHHGDLNFAHEQIVYNTTPNGRGEFSWVLEITSGTGRYAGATGYLQGAGNAPPSTGVSTSKYLGEITLH